MDITTPYVPIKCKKAFGQGIRYRKPTEPKRHTMTDIDGFYDFKGKGFLMLEYKRHGSRLHLGQRLLAENLIKSSRKPFVFAYATHNDTEAEYIDGDFAVINFVIYGNGDGEVHNGSKFVGKHVWELKDHCHTTFE